MYILKRAGLYVRRKWGKNLTVGIILFVVSALVLTGLLIKSASQSTFEIARNKLGATVSYTADLSSAMGDTESGGRPTEKGTGAMFTLPDDYTSITTKEIELIASNSKYVKNYTVSASLAGEAVDFSYYNPSGDTEETDTTETDLTDTDKPVEMEKSSANINIVGVDTEDKETNFNSDESTITDGRYFTAEEITDAANVVIIESTIADLNDISVGDNITIEKVEQKGPMASTNSDDSDEAVEITYEVVGIYKTSNPTDLTTSGFMGSYNLTENTMYAPYTTVLSSNLAGLEGDELTTAQAKIAENGYEVQNVTFNLKNPTDTDAFIAEVEAMDGIDKTYRSISANDAAYEQMVGPIENVASTSTVLVIVVVIAGAFIIGLLSMLSIKDRKYELGVLLSLGEARIKIVAQLISEMLIVAVLSFGLAALVSTFTAQVTTNFLLNQEISSSSEETTNDQFGGFQGGNMGKPNEAMLSNIDVDTIETLTVKVNGYDILKMFGIGIAIIIIGNVIQAMFVLRCNPKEILLER